MYKFKSVIVTAFSLLLLAGCAGAVAEKSDEAAKAAPGGADAAIAAAKEAQKKAASVDGEWRDTGDMIADAEKLAAEGKADDAIKLANKAKAEGELGYAQAVEQAKSADMSLYIR